ncbi:MAG TPA: thiamine-phosphate kinase, partial [Chitinophagaceae bacterium]|nr:thiamine-phosphate kinase [Chitinophagaceae bacterium]
TACALSGGEDYELLFTISQTDYEIVKDNKEISVIGFITEEKEGSVIITRAGNKHQLIAQGWNHAIPK